MSGFAVKAGVGNHAFHANPSSGLASERLEFVDVRPGSAFWLERQKEVIGHVANGSNSLRVFYKADPEKEVRPLYLTRSKRVSPTV
jgi:hypothetical protein